MEVPDDSPIATEMLLFAYGKVEISVFLDFFDGFVNQLITRSCNGKFDCFLIFRHKLYFFLTAQNILDK